MSCLKYDADKDDCRGKQVMAYPIKAERQQHGIIIGVARTIKIPFSVIPGWLEHPIYRIQFDNGEVVELGPLHVRILGPGSKKVVKYVVHSRGKQQSQVNLSLERIDYKPKRR